MKLKVWFAETRPQFLLLSVVLAFLGSSIAWYDSLSTTRFSFHWGHAPLAFLGLLLCHISVNVLNDYFDYKSGIDLKTKRTPFSGGSGIWPAAQMKPTHVLWLGIGSLILAVPIGVYFVIVTGWALLPILLVAAFCTVLYTPLLTRMGWPEWAPGVGMGFLPVVGMYFIQSGFYNAHIFIAAMPSGILVHNLLLLNEFPDIPADREAGRRTLPITLGKQGAWLIYSALTIIVYLWIAYWVAVGAMPVFSLIALLTMPFALKAIWGGRNYNDLGQLVPAMSNNIMVVLLTQFLLGVGYILAGVV
jgi:1,4-dihydroxy-2-naphthoate octaprenyltransferase